MTYDVQHGTLDLVQSKMSSSDLRRLAMEELLLHARYFCQRSARRYDE